jgi:hypothetical protein
MRHKSLVSIIVDNFNYGRYLAEAIDSAVQQVYDATEVIVVDDGSTDNSREVIASYGDRIIAVLQENNGQAAAFNAGFARSTGDIVMFLDADDRLLPGVAEQVATAFRAHGNIARVQYRVGVIDAAGKSTGWTIPPRYLRMANGDIRSDLRRMSNYAWPPTSGHAFSAWSLSRMLPMPEQDLRVSADYYLLRSNALLAPIVSLDEVVGAQYRLHGANAYYTRGLNLDQLRRHVELVRRSHPHIRDFAAELGYASYPANPADLVDTFLLAHRLALLRLDHRPPAMAEDERWSLMWMGMAAAIQRPETSMVRLLSSAWFPMMALAPKPLAGWLAEVFLNPGARRLIERLRPMPLSLIETICA